MSLALGIHLVRSGRISAEQLIDALETCVESRPQLGQLALQEGMLSLSQLFEVLATQRMEGKAFGQIAVERQFLTRGQLANLLLMQRERELDICDVLRSNGTVRDDEFQARQAEWRLENRKRETFAIGALRQQLGAKSLPLNVASSDTDSAVQVDRRPPRAAVV